MLGLACTKPAWVYMSSSSVVLSELRHCVFREVGKGQLLLYECQPLFNLYTGTAQHWPSLAVLFFDAAESLLCQERSRFNAIKPVDLTQPFECDNAARLTQSNSFCVVLLFHPSLLFSLIAET